MSTTENTATEKRDVYATVTSQIIAAIEKGVGNWRMPWHTSGKYAFSPVSSAAGKPTAASTRFASGRQRKPKAMSAGSGEPTSSGPTSVGRFAGVRSRPLSFSGSSRTLRENLKTAMNPRRHPALVCCSRAAMLYSMPRR